MQDKVDQTQKSYLEQIKFDKRLKKLKNKLKNKSIIVYGTGRLFQTIACIYDLSGLNIVAVCDRTFNNHKQGERFLGYPVCSYSEILDYSPDCILVGTLNFVKIIDELELIFGDKIRIYPLIKKGFFELLKEFRNLDL